MPLTFVIIKLSNYSVWSIFISNQINVCLKVLLPHRIAPIATGYFIVKNKNKFESILLRACNILLPPNLLNFHAKKERGKLCHFQPYNLGRSKVLQPYTFDTGSISFGIWCTCEEALIYLLTRSRSVNCICNFQELRLTTAGSEHFSGDYHVIRSKEWRGGGYFLIRERERNMFRQK